MNSIKWMAIVTIVFMTACSSSKKGYTITGETSYNGKIYLNKADGYNFLPIDSAQIVDGKFSITGRVDACDQYFLTFENKKGAFGFFLDNENIHIAVSDEHPYYSKVTKSGVNMEYQMFTTEMNEQIKKQSEERKKYFAAATSEERDSLIVLLQDYGKKQIDLAQSTFDNNIAKPYASTILMQYMKNSFTLDQLDSVISKMPENARNNNAGRMLIDGINNTRKSAEGMPYINIEQPSPVGEMISLKDVLAKNKCVLIDFWASWCSPCIASIPELKKTYEKYHEQGFEIYAVSIDSKKESWENAIEKHALPWVHVSELKGWGTQAKNDYAVEGVPTTVLLNKEGVIVARNCHGEELDAKIKECLEL